ncbi:sigma-70 family RNA polymerase sigma factor [Nocardioides sp. KR10-350]|uniref:RNA polymerase sigma factor n=1 Tax=Nocardioides cheoyonin TaxID=3156615 RepID=UPI0032B588F9
MSADDDVVAAAKRGDPDAWRELYRAHAGRLLVWLEHRSPTDTAAHAEDLASETWLTAARKLGDFQGSAEEFAGWLFGIARRLAANARRSSGRRRTSPSETIGSDADRPVPGPETSVLADDWVRSALAVLSARERDVVACTEVVGLDAAATAEALGMTQVAVRVTRHRALKRLRARLGGPEPSPA